MTTKYTAIKTITANGTVRYRLRPKTGYRSPPVHTRYKPGQSGNPKGRPRAKDLDMSEEIRDVFMDDIVVTINGKQRRMPRILALIRQKVIEALKGDEKAANFAFKIAREHGVPQLVRKRSQTLDMSGLSPEEHEQLIKTWPIVEKLKGLNKKR